MKLGQTMMPMMSCSSNCKGKSLAKEALREFQVTVIASSLMKTKYQVMKMMTRAVIRKMKKKKTTRNSKMANSTQML